MLCLKNIRVNKLVFAERCDEWGGGGGGGERERERGQNLKTSAQPSAILD